MSEVCVCICIQMQMCIRDSCTSASSGIGDSGNLLEEMAGTGDWQDGQRFHSNASASDVQAWVEELGLAK